MKKAHKASIALLSHLENLGPKQTTKSNLEKVLLVQDNFHHLCLAFSSSLTAVVKFQTVRFSCVLGVHLDIRR